VPAVAFLLCSPLPGEAMKQPVQRRLAAILATDVAGYSRLMGADEEGSDRITPGYLGKPPAGRRGGANFEFPSAGTATSREILSPHQSSRHHRRALRAGSLLNFKST
jgi:hypothetical protein